MSQVPNSVAAAGRRNIVAPTLQNHGPSLARFVAVCCASTCMNGGVLLVLFLLTMGLGIGLGSEANAEEAGDVEQKTEVEETQKDFDLTNDDIGIDDSVKLNYNVDRIE